MMTTRTKKEQSKKPETIYGEYFILVDKHVANYGINTVVLYQVGSFFEIYGAKPDINVMVIERVAKTCNLRVVAKTSEYNGTPVLMAGFRDYALDDYIEKIMADNMTAVVYIQEDKDDGEKGKKRVLSQVYSPGTFVSYQEDGMKERTSHLMCIWQKPIKTKNKGNRFICGISAINVSTGKSAIFEFDTMDETTIIDELKSYQTIFCPSEVIYISSMECDKHIRSIFPHHIAFHIVDMSSPKIKNAENQVYMEAILNKQFGQDSFQNCYEFNHYTFATQSYCYLLDFIYEHNSDLVKHIQLPIFNNNGKKMNLANHTLKQLNIVDDGVGEGVYSSVLHLLNKCCSPMGRRRFKEQLLAPTFDKSWLQTEYDAITEMMKPTTEILIPSFRRMLGSIGDLEKISRQISLQRIFPSSLYTLYHSLRKIEGMHVCLAEMPSLQEYLIQYPDFLDSIKEFDDFMIQHLNIEQCEKINAMNLIEIEDDSEIIPILKLNRYPELQQIVHQMEKNNQELDEFKQALNHFIMNKKVEDCIKIHKTDKMGIKLQLNKTNATELKNSLKKTAFIELSLKKIETRDIEIRTINNSTYEIDCSFMISWNKIQETLKTQLKEMIEKEYANLSKCLETDWIQTIDILAEYVGKLDMLVCKAFNAKTYHYCCPTLEDGESSKLKTTELRHPLIEHLLQHELYVSNDVELNENGILLFGINSSGKTSLLRSIGISIILAQSGNFVPATSFHYTPYKSIFSRILGNDNLFKGHSSFAVEMTELRVILKMADNYSLILADEISKGSEIDSAISITTASLQYFIRSKASFMITSHLHEIVGFEELQNTSLSMKHLTVSYDYEKDKLMYDRKLKNGSGESFYGLLVCKSLHLPNDFIESAYTIRNKYLKQGSSILSQKTSVYNAKKIRGLCEICHNEMGEEVHHIIPQKEADVNGFFKNGIHKNHVANLSSLCSKCHDKIHSMDSFK